MVILQINDMKNHLLNYGLMCYYIHKTHGDTHVLYPYNQFP